jgi:hypothetical protein
VALVGDADSNVDQFFGERIESAGGHDLLYVFPGSLEGDGIVSNGLPEIVDPISFAGGHYVVVYGSDFRAGIFVLDQA